MQILLNSYLLSLWNASLTKHVDMDHTWPRCGNVMVWSVALLWAMRGISMGHGLPYDINWKKTLQGWLINFPPCHSYDQSRVKCLHSDFNNYLRKLWEIIGVCFFFFWKGAELTNTLIYLHPNLVAGIMQVLYLLYTHFYYINWSAF